MVDWSFDGKQWNWENYILKPVRAQGFSSATLAKSLGFQLFFFLFVMAESLRLVCENLWFGFHLVFPLRVGCLAQLSVVERPL